MVAIKTIDLTKDFGDVVAVNGVNLEVYEGEIFALLVTGRSSRRARWAGPYLR